MTKNSIFNECSKSTLTLFFLKNDFSANNADPERAAQEIGSLLLPGGSGWNLLQSVRILAGAGGGCIETFVSQGLGSCFVRTLYLLLDTQFENIENEKVTVFISSFGQLLSRLLRSSITTEDLVAKGYGTNGRFFCVLGLFLKKSALNSGIFRCKKLHGFP